jgi:sialate O-acetylesterase
MNHTRHFGARSPAAALVLAGLVFSGRAEVHLPALISDHMVLQQDATNRIWGTARPAETVRVSFRGQSLETRADSGGRWQICLQRLPAGGPDELTISGKNTLVIRDVLVGEVWLASGQSNMRWEVSRSDNADKEIPQADWPKTRYFQVALKVAETPQEDVAGAWQLVNPATVGRLSGIGYYFSRALYQTLGAPVGLVQATYGATPAQAWTRRDVLQGDPQLQVYLQRWEEILRKYPKEEKVYERQLSGWQAAVDAAKARGETPPKKPAPPDGPGGPSTPGGLWNAMIAPLTPFTIRGVLWYQWESNSGQDDACLYRQLFPAMIEDWRRQWRQGPFPFFFAQLSIDAGKNPWPELRESQFRTLQLTNTAMVVTIDRGEPFGQHPSDKTTIGERFALAARALVYGEKIEYSGPVFRKAVPEGQQIRVFFDHCGTGLRSRDGGPLKLFEVTGSDQTYFPAEVKIDGTTLLLSSPEVEKPVAARYAWINDARPANLVNDLGLPASPFRSEEERPIEAFSIPVPSFASPQTMWPTQTLFTVPATYPVNDTNLQADAEIRPIFYDGPPFRGKPTRVFAWVGVPSKRQGRVPGIVLVHGGGGTAFRYWTKLWVDRGYAAIAMDTSGQMPASSNPSSNDRKGHPDSGPTADGVFSHVDDPPADQQVYHAVTAIVRGHSLLRSLPEVDPDRTGLTGISWGGMFAEIAAGVDPRFKFAAPVYGCGFLGEDSWFLEAVMQTMGREQALKWLTLWDPSQYIGYARMPMLFCDGTNDKHFRPPSWQKTYRTAPGSRTLSMKVRMGHGHPPSGDPKEITVFADSILRGQPPLARVVGQGRDGDLVWAACSTAVPVEKAELVYTKDAGKWRIRRWETAPADINPAGNRITAHLPQGTTAHFINLIDSRGCIVSTEHEEAGASGKPVGPVPGQSLRLLFSDARDITNAWGKLLFGATPLEKIRDCDGAGFSLAFCAPLGQELWEVYGQVFDRTTNLINNHPVATWKLVRATTRDGSRFENVETVFNAEPAVWTDHLGLAYNPDRKEFLAIKMRMETLGFAYRGFFSSDGRTWKEHPETLFYDFDSLGLFWNGNAHRFVCISKTIQPYTENKHIKDHQSDARTSVRRVLSMRSSADGKTWEPPDSLEDVFNSRGPGTRKTLRTELLTLPDAHDPPDMELYRGVGFWYHDRAFMTVLNYAASPLLPMKHGPQLDTEWWVCNDGLRWDRPYRGLNAFGANFPDVYCITHNPMVIDGRLLFHFGSKLLGMKQDRISYVGARANAEFSTRAFQMPKSDLRLNAAVPAPDRAFATKQAYVMAAVMDESGALVAGFEADKCVIQSADGLALPLAWNGRSAGELAGRQIRLRFHLRSANIYAVVSSTPK